MTTQTMTRREEIQAIWQQYQGLYIVAGVLIGLLIFPFLELLINDLSELLLGLVPEAVGIIFTVLIIDQLNHHRQRQQRKLALFRQAKSRLNEFAVDAIYEIQDEGCWDELLKYYWDDKYNRSNLSRVQWAGGINLRFVNLNSAYLPQANLAGAHLVLSNLTGANLQSANLTEANLQGANLTEAKLSVANLTKTSLQRANLTGTSFVNANLTSAYLLDTNLTGANLQSANLTVATLINVNLTSANLHSVKLTATNLEGSNLTGANLQNAKLTDANLQKVQWADEDGKYPATLPDGTKWTSDTDMRKFTDRTHPEFEAALEKVNAIHEEMDFVDLDNKYYNP